MSVYRRYREKLKVRAESIHGSACADCGSTRNLEYAHICPTKVNGKSRGSKRRYLDIINNASCYLRLCKRCHEKRDSST